MPEFITITHPDLGTAEVAESSLGVWADKGWKRAEPNPPAAAERTTQPAAAVRPSESGR